MDRGTPLEYTEEIATLIRSGVIELLITEGQSSMPAISCLPDQERQEFLTRLRRIEGQARGVQKMIEDDRDCLDILQQVSSARSALTSLSGEMLEAFALHCLRNPGEFASHEAAVEQAVRSIVRSSR